MYFIVHAAFVRIKLMMIVQQSIKFRHKRSMQLSYIRFNKFTQPVFLERFC